jgi:hypothetical protein
MTIFLKKFKLKFCEKNILFNFTKDETLMIPRIIDLAKKK